MVTRYELLERIGAGRMAEIFRGKAVAAGGFEKPVAIKRILPHLSKDPRFVELLIAEAKILSVLRHRNIVQIFDVGLGDDGTYFLVMEYVDGVDLRAVQRALERRRARMPLELALHAGAEVCDALEAAQQTPTPDGRPLALVHRDVSPSNVLVSRAGEVKLTDFGLARRPEDRRTAAGLRGRFGYVSPEQLAGLPVDGRSDVFSLGVLVWELAVGRPLFSGMADYEAMRAITDLPIPPPSTQDRGLPADLDAILAEALARDPDRRLPSAGELGMRLRGLRYSLESSSGDPAAALARMVAGIEREPPTFAPALAAEGPAPAVFERAEGSVVHLRTADVFAHRDEDGTGLLEARRLLAAFEDAETRMSSLPAAFDDISTGGRPLRPFDDRTELTAAPMHLGPEPDELSVSDDDAGDEPGRARDTSVSDAVDGPDGPAARSSAIATLRGGGVVAARGAREKRQGAGPESSRAGAGDDARTAAARDTARGGALPETLRGGQAAPASRASGPAPSASSGRSPRAPALASAPAAREPERPRAGAASTAPREPERSSARAPGRIAPPALDDDWTEKTPPPPPPPGAESDPSIGVPLLGSLAGLPSLGALSAGPVNAGPRLPGLPPTDSSSSAVDEESPSPFAPPSSPFAEGAPPRAETAPPFADRRGEPGAGGGAPSSSRVPGFDEPYPPAEGRRERGRERDPVGPPSSYAPPASPPPWAWQSPSPGGPLAFVRRWWPVGLGAIAIAILSFVITQAAIEPTVEPLRTPPPVDARPAADDAPAASPPADAGP